MNDNLPTISEQTSVSSVSEFRTRQGYTIEALIGAWLMETARTETSFATYKEIIVHFRSLLLEQGLDLLFESPPDNPDFFAHKIWETAQRFKLWRSPYSRRHGPVTSAEARKRLYALRSFYNYAIASKHWRGDNPLLGLKVPQEEPYSRAQAIAPEQIEQLLSLIDDDTDEGLQAKALLVVAISTGHRARELEGLSRGDISAWSQTLQIHWRLKGQKTTDDVLEKEVAQILLAWILRFYGPGFWDMPPETPVWVHLYHESTRGSRLHYHGISGICQRYLGTSKVHALRHSFALIALLEGADSESFRQLMGHKSLATSTVYSQALRLDKNKYTSRIVARIGLKKHG